MLIRYAMLMGAAAAAVWVALNLGSRGSTAMLVDAGHVPPQADLSIWVLGMIVTVMVLSLCRVVVFGLPSMFDNWVRTNKSWLFVGGAGAFIYGMLYLV